LLLPGTLEATPAQEVPASAEKNSAQPTVHLRPYRTTYKTTARGLSLTLQRNLAIDSEGRCRLTSEGSLLVVGLSEVSTFHIEDGRVEPQSYIYQGTGLINRRREVHFQPDSPVIRSLYKNEWYALPDVGHTLDRMSQQEQMRLNLLRHGEPLEEMTFTVADGRKVRDIVLAFDGRETLQTPLGKVETLRYERQRDSEERESLLWVAPAWDYLVVKTLHTEEGRTVEATLVAAEIEGRPVGA
jgi:hypothetical protein